MATYTVTHNNGSTANIEADRFETDGAGIRFYDEDDRAVATFAYGLIVSVVDSAVTFAAPPEND
ncbi:MAG: hypothetical protein HLUCCA12_12225 [Rhodobacteraceae bacterium HLUCCA12]|nr:MAG: hypothetical protein HLUCCA12_12225 [Rhodobacteraceae bacterium HLUCCA12]